MIHTRSNLFTILTATVIYLLAINTHSSSPKLNEIEFTSVDDAVSQITAKLEGRNFEIALVVNHSAAAASVGLELRPTQVILARQQKNTEYKMLRRSDTIGIDLPVKVLVYEDESGAIQVRDNSIGYLIDRHDAQLFDDLWEKSKHITRKYGENETGLISVRSSQPIQETVDALAEAIGSNPNFRIPLILDFCEGKRRSCGQVIVFGNPNAGTPLMQVSQETAIDLPQKFLVSTDRTGNVIITYNDPFFVAKRHNIQGQDARLEAISGALANFAAQGASAP